jgi:hypothetical protein
LHTDMWQEGSRIHFQTKVVESNNIVIGSKYSLNYNYAGKLLKLIQNVVACSFLSNESFLVCRTSFKTLLI